VYSALAYQGYGRMIDVEEVRRINDWAIGSRWPDLVVLLDTAAEVLTTRTASRELDRFEREDAAFHQRVLDGFRAMAAADPDHWLVVDGNGSIDEVHAAVRGGVDERLRL
jgi:dTMP kinase